MLSGHREWTAVTIELGTLWLWEKRITVCVEDGSYIQYSKLHGMSYLLIIIKLGGYACIKINTVHQPVRISFQSIDILQEQTRTEFPNAHKNQHQLYLQ